MKIRIEMLTELFEEIGIKATEYQIKQVSEDYALHLEMEQELGSHQNVEGKLNLDSCNNCNKLKENISQLRVMLRVHEDSVKSRRGCDKVWVSLSENAVKYSY